MKKTVIAIVGSPKAGKTTASKMLEEHGFCLLDINQKVRQFAQSLFSAKALNGENADTIIEQVRDRGRKVSKNYWLNLVLVSVPEEVDYVVIDNACIEGLRGSPVIPYQITREFDDEPYDCDVIYNSGSLADLEQKMAEIAELLKK